MRAFIAIDLPPEIREGISDLIRQFKKIQQASIKYVDNENLHITLKFLGDSDDRTINSLLENLKTVSPSMSSIYVETAGTFPGDFFPKVAWVGILKNKELNELYNRIENAAVNAGFSADERDFQPHITIARIKGKASEGWIQLVRDKSHEKFGSYKPQGYTVYRSDLSANGPVYTRIAFFPFKEDSNG